MGSRNFRRTVLCMALGLGLSSMAVPPAHAGNNDGTVVGHTEAGAVVTINNAQTGFSRTVTADAKGNYRIPFLPVGDYVLSVTKDGKTLTAPANVTVTLGNATTVNLGSNAQSLDAVNVTGTAIITAVDVTSTESAVNVTG